MSAHSEFDSIRPYEGSEIKEAIDRLLASKDFIDLFSKITQTPKENIVNALGKVNGRDDFQKYAFGYYSEQFIKTTTDGVSTENINSIKDNQSCIFLTNHRDIILDSAMLNFKLREEGKLYTQAAIGSNLLITDWITDLVKLNSCFVIERDISVKEMLSSSLLRSKYIRETIANNRNSIWIAQREGRTKNGDDKTQPSLLKMLKIGGPNDFIEAFESLNIRPTSISYEWEPCDIAKMRELYLKQTNEFVKTPADDMDAMVNGMVSYKGKVNYHFSEITRKELETINTLPNNGAKIEALAKLIDTKIYQGYKLWKNNYIAYDLQYSTNKFTNYYTPEDKEKFIIEMTNRVSKIDGNVSLLNNIFLNIYANPVKNKIQ